MSSIPSSPIKAGVEDSVELLLIRRLEHFLKSILRQKRLVFIEVVDDDEKKTCGEESMGFELYLTLHSHDIVRFTKCHQDRGT